ncbi:MAG: DNA-directed RNA polymerase subunit omega [Nitrospirae bacterium]|nr:DNA-directed RNA polymerase subunit omega [Nitrospirota bacterium]
MDIISLPVELDPNKIDGRFRLVNIITQRAKELTHRGKPKITTKAKKITTIALEEAVSEALEFITGDDARRANEEAKKLDYKRFLEEKRRESEQEDLSELEKDLKFYLDEKEDTSKRSLESLFSDGDISTELDTDTGAEAEDS